jgi:hypothetical protein
MAGINNIYNILIIWHSIEDFYIVTVNVTAFFLRDSKKTAIQVRKTFSYTK